MANRVKTSACSPTRRHHSYSFKYHPNLFGETFSDSLRVYKNSSHSLFQKVTPYAWPLKHEWSILQTLEATNRLKPIASVEVTEHRGYKIASLMAEDETTRIWIMLDPASPPFYKKIPSNYNFSLSENDLEKIRIKGSPITTTYQALKSHLKQTTAK